MIIDKKFIKKILLFISPVLLLGLLYTVFDPFQILYNYESYPTNFAKSLNRDRISTQTFLNNNPTQKYRSFIFGSSRSSVFYTTDWAKYINDSTPFHFDASCETVSGIATKLEFIEKQGNKIDNALFVLDRSIFEYEQDTLGSVFVQDYRVSGLSPIRYHVIFMNTFFSKGFFWAFFDNKFSGKFKDYMRNYLEFREIIYTPIKNDFIFKSYIDEIAKDSVAYYSKPDYFYERPTEKIVSNTIIKPYQEQYLKRISEVLKRQKSDYKVVLGPFYNQIYFHEKDLALLEKYFGKDKIYDFSGQNEFTNDKRNYYEVFHYKPTVAREIMKRIYQK